MTTEALAEPEFTPATADDMTFIRDAIAREHMDDEDLRPEQFITLREDGRIVAFGRVKPYQQATELASLVVAGDRRGKGLGETMVRELIRRFPDDEVYVTTNLPVYFERLGFMRTTILPDEIAAKVARYDGGPRGAVQALIYDRRYDQLPTLGDVYRAKHLIENHLPRTPLLRNAAMSRELGFEAYLKLENLQPIGAFKVRGGVYLCAGMSEEDRARGIIGASTGNHGQSLAYGANLFGMRCVISMPEEANPMKVESMRALGADVQFHGTDFERAREWAERHAEAEGLRYVHHATAMDLVAGVATISLEIVEDLPDVDVIISPIGGGSGAVGHCIVAKQLRPGTEVIGVQAAGAPAVYNSWRDRCLQTAPIATAAEGLATGNAYFSTVRVLADHLGDMVLVGEDELQSAIVRLARSAHVIAEEAGAATTAAAVQLADRLRGKKVAIVVSGGNVPVDHLRRVLLDAKG